MINYHKKAFYYGKYLAGSSISQSFLSPFVSNYGTIKGRAVTERRKVHEGSIEKNVLSYVTGAGERICTVLLQADSEI